MALTLAFERCTDDFSVGCDYLSDLYVCDTADFYHPDSSNCFWYFNWTVAEIYEKAVVALSGVCNATINSCSDFNMNGTTQTTLTHHSHFVQTPITTTMMVTVTIGMTDETSPLWTLALSTTSTTVSLISILPL